MCPSVGDHHPTIDLFDLVDPGAAVIPNAKSDLVGAGAEPGCGQAAVERSATSGNVRPLVVAVARCERSKAAAAIELVTNAVGQLGAEPVCRPQRYARRCGHPISRCERNRGGGSDK